MRMAGQLASSRRTQYIPTLILPNQFPRDNDRKSLYNSIFYITYGQGPVLAQKWIVAPAALVCGSASLVCKNPRTSHALSSSKPSFTCVLSLAYSWYRLLPSRTVNAINHDLPKGGPAMMGGLPLGKLTIPVPTRLFLAYWLGNIKVALPFGSTMKACKKPADGKSSLNFIESFSR